MAFFFSPFSGGGLGALFGPLGQNQPRRPIIGFDTSVLATQPPLPASAFERGPAVIPPWRTAEEAPPLLRRIAALRGLKDFIDPKARGVDGAGGSVDAKATFVLFDALKKLEALAQYAADDATPEVALADLDAQFRRGLDQVRAYVRDTELDKLTLLTGARTSRAEPPVSMGKDSQTFTGRMVQTGGRDDPIPGLVGNEVFTVSITDTLGTVALTIDLAAIAQPVTLNSLADHINAQIEAVPEPDANGNPMLDENGDPVARFSSRVAVVSDDNYDHGLEVRSSLFETVRLTPAAAEPAVYVSAVRSDPLGGTPAASAITRFDDAAGLIASGRRMDVSGVDRNATELARLGAEAEEAPETVAAATHAAAVAVDSEGFIYTVGTSAGDFGSQINTSATQDVFLTKLDSEGNVVFSRLLGAAQSAEGFALAIDSQDNVVVAGRTADNLAPGALVAGTDSFVAKFGSTGDRLFTYQLDTAAEDEAVALAIDGNDDILVSGFTRGAVDGATPGLGGRDAMLLKIDGTSGLRTAAAVFGSAGDERGQAVAIAADGNILLASREDGRAVLRKLDAADPATVLFEMDLGALGDGGAIAGLKVDGANVYLAGTASDAAFTGGAATANGAHAGGADGFLLKLSDAGGTANADYITYLGTAAGDAVNALAVAGGHVYLAGSTTGDLAGTGRHGVRDGFVARLDAAGGAVEEVEQFGLMLTDAQATGIAFAPTGASVLDKLGLPQGSLDRVQTRDLVTQTTARVGDYFEVSIDGRRAQRVAVRAGDDLTDLAKRISRLSLRGEIEATVTGGEITIRATGKSVIDLIPGEGERDLLAKFALRPQRLVGPEGLFETGDEAATGRTKKKKPQLGGTFALELDRPLGLATTDAAKFSLKQVQAAIETVQRAFRSLTPNPFADGRPDGHVPPHLSSQIANYTAGLQRLLLGGGFSV